MIQGLCEQYAIDPRTVTVPSVFVISPNTAESNDDFPLPTRPTTASSSPFCGIGIWSALNPKRKTIKSDLEREIDIEQSRFDSSRGPGEITMNDTEQLITFLRLSPTRFDVDGSFLQFLSAKVVRQSIDGDVGLDQRREDDREDGERESEE